MIRHWVGLLDLDVANLELPSACGGPALIASFAAHSRPGQLALV